jgi:hypothetical protein
MAVNERSIAPAKPSILNAAFNATPCCHTQVRQMVSTTNTHALQIASISKS